MDHAATMQRVYDLLSTGDVDGFGDVLADDFEIGRAACRERV